jgi:hypothetical protein
MPPRGLTNAEVLEQVRRLVKEGRIRWTHHIQLQLEARGLAKDQVKECLSIGYFEEEPTVPNRFGDIEYSFRMKAKVDGLQMRVAASLVPETRVVAITVFDAEKQS